MPLSTSDLTQGWLIKQENNEVKVFIPFAMNNERRERPSKFGEEGPYDDAAQIGGRGNRTTERGGGSNRASP